MFSELVCFNNLNNNLFSSQLDCIVLILTWTADSDFLRWQKTCAAVPVGMISPLDLWLFTVTFLKQHHSYLLMSTDLERVKIGLNGLTITLFFQGEEIIILLFHFPFEPDTQDNCKPVISPLWPPDQLGLPTGIYHLAGLSLAFSHSIPYSRDQA